MSNLVEVFCKIKANGSVYVQGKNSQPELTLKSNQQAHFLLALHSSSQTLGVAVQDLRENPESIKKSTFQIGKKLSNNLFTCINQLLPYKYWNKIARIAVATGPGGFTGTRLSIAMSRTIAQQLQCQLDGISSFSLMAKRLSENNNLIASDKPFWIKSYLKRRGIIAGQYQLKANSNIAYCNRVLELKIPSLIKVEESISPAIEAKENISEDTLELLRISCSAHNIGKESLWEKVLPIYPTSPVDNIQ